MVWSWRFRESIGLLAERRLVVGTPQNGLEQFYTFADALAMASWLNVFIRQADVVTIACIAQSVNVISPIITRLVG